MTLTQGARAAGSPNRQQRRLAARRNRKAKRGATKPDIDHLVRSAGAHREAGRLRDAALTYHQVLVHQPNHLEALHGAGLTAYNMGDCALAIHFLQSVIALKPDFAEAHSNLGTALAIAGRTDEALSAYRRAIEIAPRYANAHYNLGATLQATCQFLASQAAYHTAIALRPDHFETYTNLAAVQYEIGDLGAVKETCRQAINLQPNDPLPHTILGQALLASGARDEAEAALRRAIAVAPRFARAHYYLGHILFREQDLQPAAHLFEQAIHMDPTLGKVRLFLGAIYDLRGDAAAATREFDALTRHPEKADYLIDSWTYVKNHRGPQTQLFSDSFETLEYALDNAHVDGLSAEFGVRFGTSLNFLASHLTQEIHGFDSFEGLPESWDGVEPGLYSTCGVLPKVAANVRLHVGLFADTLPGFTTEHPGPIRFMNVDCDIYGSTRTIFEHLADRIVPGTIIVFDEYLMNPNWRQDEFKAFQETVQDRGWTYEYLAFNLFTKQAVVRIL